MGGCSRRAAAKQKIKSAFPRKRAKAVSGDKVCIRCGKRYAFTLDPIVEISFFNVLSSAIFMRGKYNLNNIGKQKLAVFTRYCRQYASLFLCPACEKYVAEFHQKIYAIYRERKKL
jgi:hypothetical protein